MPEIRRFSEFTVGFATSNALGMGVVLLLLIALRLLLPVSDRSRLRLPLVFFVLYLLTLPPQLLIDPAESFARILSGVSVFLLLTAFARCLFILVVDFILGVRLGRRLPRIIHDIIQGLIYLGVVLITLRAAGVEPGSLLTFSALLTAAIGFSLQDPIGNLFAGLSLQAQSPFEVGDWIQTDPDPRLMGQVIEINWRETKILTAEQIEIIIPNGALAKASIRNFTKPTPLARRTLEVQGPYDVSPRLVEEALLSAAHAAPGVLAEPPAYVLIPKFGDSGINYSLCYFINDFARRDRVDTLVRQRIWYAFQRAGIGIPFPTQAVHIQDSSPEARKQRETEERAQRLKALRGVDFMTPLPGPLLERLATLSRTNHYMMSEVIIRQGDLGQELFIVQKGEVSVLLGRVGGSTAEVARLGPGKFFGEMSLMTGERRSATVQAATDCELVKVDKAAFQEILAATPDLAERITEVLIARQSEIDENVSARATRSRSEVETKSNVLLGKIKQFFAL